MAAQVKQQAWWREPTKAQWAAFLAAWSGWVLDAFDFTIYLLVMHDIAKEFGVSPTAVAGSLTLTLLIRLLGSFVAQRIAGIVSLLDEADERERERLVRALSVPPTRISLSEPWRDAEQTQSEEASAFTRVLERELGKPYPLQVVSIQRARPPRARPPGAPRLVPPGGPGGSRPKG